MRMTRTSLNSLVLILLFASAMRGATAGTPHASTSPATPPGGSPRNLADTSSGSSGANVYSEPSSLADEVQRIGNAIETNKTNQTRLAALRKDLPTHWEVVTSDHRYYVSAEALDTLLSEAEKAKDSKSVSAKGHAAAEWAFDLATQVKGYAKAQRGTGAGASAALERILSRREFGAVKGPSALDILKQRIYRWIEEVLSGILERIGQHPMGARIFFWMVIVAVVFWLAVVLFRYWTRRARLDELEAPDSVAYTRTWQEWIQASREAAGRGDYREAVHSAYWAGISFLEDREVVRKDRTRTPREYVRLVSRSTEFVATGRKTREALSALTVTLEQVWYGRKPASNQDFANALQSVEALGCQLQ